MLSALRFWFLLIVCKGRLFVTNYQTCARGGGGKK